MDIKIQGITKEIMGSPQARGADTSCISAEALPHARTEACSTRRG
jgi:hypothetical protein